MFTKGDTSVVGIKWMANTVLLGKIRSSILHSHPTFSSIPDIQEEKRITVHPLVRPLNLLLD